MSEITNLKDIINRGRIQAIGNEILTPELAAKIGAAFGTYLGSKGIAVIAREYSNNNRMLKRAFIGGLMSSGVDILNLHSAPVSVLQFSIRRFGASAGAYFSSVSTGKMQNQIRFYDSSGIEFDIKKLDSVNEYLRQNKINRAKPLDVGAITDIPHTQDIYRKAIPQLVDQNLFKNKKQMHVVCDCSYGPGSIVLPGILTSLKVDVIAINAYENDQKSAEMYPNLRSIKSAVNIVKASQADLGVILDTDGSRALYIDETGKILTFEELMMFFMKYDPIISSTKEQPIITTKTASKIIGEFAQELGGFTLLKTRNFPGEISRELREQRGIFGGADTMKFYFPNYGPFSDGVYTTLKILEILAREKIPLSALIRSFPRTIHSYKSISTSYENMSTCKESLRELIQTQGKANIDYQDIIIGMKLIFKDLGWVSICPSMHANAVELEAEGLNAEKSEILIAKAEEFIQSII
ncbi:MAG: hypothetical protein K9W44_16765 [Candidatus Lokiarchaeota archaeon]|nr:hypothetical protein [Candidatus Harpocratesius repetitus]